MRRPSVWSRDSPGLSPRGPAHATAARHLVERTWPEGQSGPGRQRWLGQALDVELGEDRVALAGALGQLGAAGQHAERLQRVESDGDLVLLGLGARLRERGLERVLGG